MMTQLNKAESDAQKAADIADVEDAGKAMEKVLLKLADDYDMGTARQRLVECVTEAVGKIVGPGPVK